ncbi:MAG: phosphodiester glycosidase family protein [Phycisphaerae bacterium]
MKRLVAILSGMVGVIVLGASAGAETVAPGVTYTVHNVTGPNVVHVVAVDRLRSEYKLKVGWAQGKRNYTAREGTSTIAGRYDSPPEHDVLSAINGSYFDGVNLPRLIGIGQSDGQMLDTPAFDSSYQYHTVMVGPSRRPVVRTNFNHVLGTLTFADGYSMTLNQYNFYMNGPLVPINAVAAFTSHFDSSTRSSFVNPSMAVEVVLSNVSYPMRSHKEVSGIVSAVHTPTTGNAAIPAGGMVLSAWGSTKSEIVSHTHVGDRLRMRFMTDAEEYNNSDNALTGIGWVIRNGAAYTPGWANLESGAAPYSRNPRTVLAWNDDYWFQVVCDGRSANSVGMTFQEMANFLIGELGAAEAVNYDGGGSSTMVVNGTIRNVPSDGSERPVANAIMLVKQNTASAFPFSDSFGPAGRLAGWDDKFCYADVLAFSPTSPGGDGYVLRVMNRYGGADSVRRGDFGDTDYTVEADVYCDYRPEVSDDGYELSGIIARDSGTGAMGLSSFGKGNCYALLYASDTGSIRAGKYVNGLWSDFAADVPGTPLSGWHRFRIDAYGNRVRYRLDGVAICTVRDGSHPRGYYGVGYHEMFNNDANMRGARVDNFVAHVVPDGILVVDYDDDTDVDQVDFAHLQLCLSGSQVAQTLPDCQDARLDNDSDVDGDDMTIFINCLSGSGIPADPGCMSSP